MTEQEPPDDYLEWERRQSGWAFERTEMRNSSCGRILDCGHRIDRTEPYRYFVGKPRSAGRLDPIVQRRDCDVCKRADDRY